MTAVTLCNEISANVLSRLLTSYGLELHWVQSAQPIPGSHFSEPEAGLVRHNLYIRPDTPVHSALHEACHYICMNGERRQALNTDAGGDYDEENAVCYLSILLAARLSGFSAAQMLRDMDNWGYTFRLGSARDWFHKDAEDAHHWLVAYGIIDQSQIPSGMLRLDEHRICTASAHDRLI